MNKDRQPSVLIGSSSRWALAARLAMALTRHGCAVSSICPAGHPLLHVSGLKKIYRFNSLDSLGSLKAAIVKSRPMMIVPCDDQVVQQLWALHAQEPSLRELIEFSLGDAAYWNVLESRATLLETAAANGVRTPLNRVVESEEQLAGWIEAMSVLKRDGSLGGLGVLIAQTREQAVWMYRKLMRPTSFKLAMKQYLVNRESLAFWFWHTAKKAVVTEQQYIPGRPANTMVLCWGGEVLASVTVEVLRTAGATGAATVVRLLKSDEIEQASRKVASTLKLNGFHGMDFMLGLDGAAYLIELNPRSTQLGHLCLPGQGDLAGVLAAKLFELMGLEPPLPAMTADVISGDTIAFFPQAMRSNPGNEYLRTAYHDVPQEQPALVAELLLDLWPDRKWTGKLYNRVFPWERAVEVSHEDIL